MKEPIKDFYNVIKGWVETKPNGDKVYYNLPKILSQRSSNDRHRIYLGCITSAGKIIDRRIQS